MSGITYYQHNVFERDIVAVFDHAEPYTTAFGIPAYPAIFFEPTRLTFNGPRVFCPFACYQKVAQEVAAAHYPDHVRWTELLMASVQPPPLPAPEPDPMWPDVTCPAFTLEGTGGSAYARITLKSSAGQGITTLAVESHLIALWRQLQDAVNSNVIEEKK